MQRADNRVALSVDPAVSELGIHATFVDVQGLRNRASDPKFEEYKKELANRLLETYTEDFLRHDPVIEGFRALRRRIGRSVKRYPASTESLIGFLRRTGRIPTINLAVDLYNVVSLETRLTLGAHDGSKVRGNVRLRIAEGAESFQPLGSDRTERVAQGDYCYVDEGGEVLCRLDYKQTDKTKITPETTHGFFIVQGNPATSVQQVADATNRLVDLIRTHCAGRETVIYTPSQPHPGSM